MCVCLLCSQGIEADVVLAMEDESHEITCFQNVVQFNLLIPLCLYVCTNVHETTPLQLWDAYPTLL